MSGASSLGGRGDARGPAFGVQVHSELAPLECVVVSPPGREFDLMVPENLERYRPDAGGAPVPSEDYLLFDDLVLLPELAREHAQLFGVLEAMTGPGGVLAWRDLLVQTLGDEGARAAAIDRCLELEAKLYPGDERAQARAVLGGLDAPRLAEALITGRAPVTGERLFRWPAPNTLFARDLAAAVGDAVVMTYAAEPARGREMLLTRLILRHHPRFAGVPKLDIGEDARGRAGLSIEGGDVQVLSDRVVLVGVGIRTPLQAVERLAPLLFARGVEVVLGYEMPRRRASMHIDTLFTRIDAERCLIYPPLVLDPEGVGARLHVFRPGAGGAVRRADGGRDLLGGLRAVGIDLQPVFCGGSDPTHQAREQWSDGANAFALAPGIILSYGRNQRTLRELNQVGYEVVTPERFVANALYFASQGHKVVVALGGHELVRGRGGPRCLTLPLRRARTP